MLEENQQDYRKNNTGASTTTNTSRLLNSLWQFGTLPWTATKKNVSVGATKICDAKSAAVGWLFGRSHTQNNTDGDTIESTSTTNTKGNTRMTCSAITPVYHDTSDFDSGFVSDVEKPEVTHIRVDSCQSVTTSQVIELFDSESAESVQKYENLSNHNNNIPEDVQILFLASKDVSKKCPLSKCRASTLPTDVTQLGEVEGAICDKEDVFFETDSGSFKHEDSNYVQEISQSYVKSSTPKKQTLFWASSVLCEDDDQVEIKELSVDTNDFTSATALLLVTNSGSVSLQSTDSEDISRRKYLAHQIEEDEAITQAVLNGPSSDFLRVVGKLDERLRDLKCEAQEMKCSTKTIGKEFKDTEEMASRLMKEMRMLRSDFREMAYLDELIHLLKGQLDRITLRKWPFRAGRQPLKPGEEADLII